MRKTAAWLVLVLIAATLLYFLYRTEDNYLRFTRTIHNIEFAVQGVEPLISGDIVRLKFGANIENPTTVKMWLEGLDYSLYANAEYVGSYYTVDKKVEIPPGAKQIPLEADLKSYYRDQFLKEQEKGVVAINISGTARIMIQIGKAEMKVRIPFRGQVSLEGGENEKS